MNTRVVPELVIARVDSDEDIADMVDVAARSGPRLPPPRPENLRHQLHARPNLTYLIARLGDEPVGRAFVEADDSGVAHADAHLEVVTDARSRGIGSALLKEASRRAAAYGKTELCGETWEDDVGSRGFFERRGYRVVGGERAVVLDLRTHDPEPVGLPPGVRVAARTPEHVEGMYEVARHAGEDIPGSEAPSFEAFRAQDVDRPSLRPELCFVALAGDEVIGYAILNDFGREAHHGLTAVRRDWRRRGVATALKRTQIAKAKQLGFDRLVTESEERNDPMRLLNVKLGYQPEASLSTVVLLGPLLP
jgi:GNAT superfamily N-acetyltransferase